MRGCLLTERNRVNEEELKEVEIIVEPGQGQAELNIGPQHPGSGHMRLVAKIRGDIVEELVLDPGYVHRSVEKLCENRHYMHLIPLVERPTIIDSIHMNMGYIMAVEKIMNLEVPERALYLRSFAAEVNRISSHLYGLGILGIFIGHSTMFMWGFADREPFVEILQNLTGARITNSYVVPGGVRRDLSQSVKELAIKAVSYLRKKIKDYENIFLNNPNVRARLENVGVISREKAIELGLVGPNLRASSVPYDVRKIEPYAAYQKLDFEIPVYKEGDAFARTLVRMEEVQQSMNMIMQIIKEIPEGEILNQRILKQIPPQRIKKWYEEQKRIVFPGYFASMRPPKGDAISRVEASRGELVYYVVSDGSSIPYRVRMITPSYMLIKPFMEIAKGHRIADIPAIYGSLDYFPPEADR